MRNEEVLERVGEEESMEVWTHYEVRGRPIAAIPTIEGELKESRQEKERRP